MIETLILSITSFIATNIDDIFIDALFFSEAKTTEDRIRIFFGKYIGIGLLTALSIWGALGVQSIPAHYIGYLGIVPILLGIKEIISGLRSGHNANEEDNKKTSSNLPVNTAIVTLANGADNIGVYIPLFAGFAPWQLAVTVCVFALLIAVWCCIGKALAGLPVLKNFLAKYRNIAVPAVYMALGAYILIKNIL